MAQKVSGRHLAGRITKLASTIEGASVETVRAAADRAEKRQLDVMRPDSGGDLRLSGVGRAKGRPGNAKIGVQSRVSKDSGFGVGASAIVKAIGPLQIINNDTSGHVIRSAYSVGRGTVGRKRIARRGFVGPVAPGQFEGSGRRAVLNIPGIGFRSSVRHPGTKGKDTWQRGQKKAQPDVAKAMSKRTTAVIKRGMKP